MGYRNITDNKRTRRPSERFNKENRFRGRGKNSGSSERRFSKGRANKAGNQRYGKPQIKSWKKPKRKFKKKKGIEFKSKWVVAINRNLNVMPGKKDNILYLGASTGTTIRYISNLTEGLIFAVENSPDMALNLVRLASTKKNIAPVFCDARDIESLKKAMFNTKINILFQDIPSLDQAEILIKASQLVDKDARIFLSLKTQSISQQEPEKTLKEVEEKLKKHFKVLHVENLEPYHKKHYFLILKKV